MNLQAIDTLGGLYFSRKISLLEYFAVFSFEEGEARTGLCKNKDTHCELSLFVALSWGAANSRVEALEKKLFREGYPLELAHGGLASSVRRRAPGSSRTSRLRSRASTSTKMEGLFFNVNNGYIEGIVRGYRNGLLTGQNYNNLTQCETIDGKDYQ